MTYIDRHIEDFDVEMALREVTSQRREKAIRFLTDNDRRQSLAAFRLLQYALEREYGIKGELRFSFAEKGKPYLSDYPAVEFNISHCARAVAVAVSDKAVGVDIEEIRPFDEELARAVLSREEFFTVESSLSPCVEFTKIWTAKEAYMKRGGKGLVDDIAGLDICGVELLQLVDDKNGFVCTVVGGNNMKWAY